MDNGDLKRNQGYKNIKWSQDEINILIKNHLVIPVKETAALLNRGYFSVRARIARLIKQGKLGEYPSQKWTESEISYLRNNYLEKTDEELVTYFNRPIGGITARAHEMGLKRLAGIKFTKEQEDLIFDLFKKGFSHQKIAEELKFCCYGTIRNFLRRKGVKARTRKEACAIKSEEKIGTRVGKLVLLERNTTTMHGKQISLWKCKCDCGKIKNIKTSLLFRKKRRVKSCGCARLTRYGEISGSHWHRVKAGAKARNIEFNITIKDAWDLFLKQNRKCALSNVNLVFGKITTASLDRVDSLKGYTLDNIQWIHKHINNMKLDFTEDEFIYFCRKISSHTSDRKIIT